MIPEGLAWLHPEVMSNINGGQIDQGVAEELKNGEDFAQHSAWNFCGYVWFANNLWHEQVMVHHVEREIMTAETLEELRNKVNDKYGWD